MDAFAITGVAVERPGGEPEWFRVEGAVGGNDAPPRLFPRVHVVRKQAIADLIAGGRIVYVLRPEAQDDLPERARVHVDSEGNARIESVTLGGSTQALDTLPRFAFAAEASDVDVARLRAIGRGEGGACEYDPDVALDRYLQLGWVTEAADGTLALSDIGRDLVRSRTM